MGYPCQDTSIHFDALRKANLERVKLWHGEKGVHHWRTADWAVAAAGEMGEYCNAVKKLTRHDSGVPAKGDDPDRGNLLIAIGKEMADVIIYLDLAAAELGLDLGACVRDKFNKVSEREGFKVFL